MKKGIKEDLGHKTIHIRVRYQKVVFDGLMSLPGTRNMSSKI